jgi:hypothetical protein
MDWWVRKPISSFAMGMMVRRASDAPTAIISSAPGLARHMQVSALPSRSTRVALDI